MALWIKSPHLWHLRSASHLKFLMIDMYAQKCSMTERPL